MLLVSNHPRIDKRKDFHFLADRLTLASTSKVAQNNPLDSFWRPTPSFFLVFEKVQEATESEIETGKFFEATGLQL